MDFDDPDGDFELLRWPDDGDFELDDDLSLLLLRWGSRAGDDDDEPDGATFADDLLPLLLLPLLLPCLLLLLLPCLLPLLLP